MEETKRNIPEEDLIILMEDYAKYFASQKLQQLIFPGIVIKSAKEFYEDDLRAFYGLCA